MPADEKGSKRRFYYLTACILAPALALILFYRAILTGLGDFLVVDEDPTPSEVVVVLNTDMEYYPRLIQAATLYSQGLVKKVLINGNRKTDALRELEAMGFQPCCPWYEERVRILELLGVPREDVITVSAEDAYDTVSEARAVGRDLMERGFTSVIITTSKSHTRRARHIWEAGSPKPFKITVVAAQTDPYAPNAWWKSGRQARWVLSEYGSWLYFFWKSLEETGNHDL